MSYISDLEIINSTNSIIKIIGTRKHLLTIPKMLVNSRVFISTNLALDLLIDCLKLSGISATGNDYNLCHSVVCTSHEYLEKKLLTHFLHNNPITFTDYIIIDQLHTDNVHILAIISYLSVVKTSIKVIILTPINTFFSTLIYQDQKRNNYDKIYDITIFKYKQATITGDILIYASDDCEVDLLYSRLHLELPKAVILTERLKPYSKSLSEFLITDKKIIILTEFERLPVIFDNIAIVIDAMSSSKHKTKAAANLRRSPCLNTCYRLIPEEEFNKLPEGDQISELELNNLILDFFKAGLNPHHIQHPINLDLLINLNVIANNSLTECGDFVRAIPLDIRNSVFLWRWLIAGHSLYPGIVIASILNSKNGSYFYIPRGVNHEDLYIQTTFNHWIGETTLHTYLNMWDSFSKSLDNLYFQLMENYNTINLNCWAKSNSVNRQQLFEALITVAKVYNIVRRLTRNIDVNVINFDIDEVVNYALPILKDIFADCAIEIVNGSADLPDLKTRYIFDSRIIVNKLCDEISCEIIPLVTHDIMTRSGIKIKYIDIFIVK